MVKSDFLMNAGEYEAMYRVEKEHWWYKGLRDYLFYWTKKSLADTGPFQMTFLDAGCGTGINLSEHEKLGIEVWGIDSSKEAVTFTQKRGIGRVFQGEIQNLPFDGGFFDLIYCMDVIVMLNELEMEAAFFEFKRCLKPDGRLIINSATIQSLYSSHDVASHVVARYSKEKIEQILNDTGFAIEKSTYRVFFLFPLLAFVKILQKIGLGSKKAEDVRGDLEKTNSLLNFIFYPIMKLENSLLKKISLPFGTSLFIVARAK